MSMTSRDIAIKYFEDHLEAKDEVIKAGYAFHLAHYDTNDAHNFYNGSRQSKCFWCFRTREDVRYDKLPAHCSSRPKSIPSINEVLNDEFYKYAALLDKAENIVLKLIKNKGLSGETLAILHHTYGYDPEVVSGVVDIPTALLKEYHEKMEEERIKSQGTFKKQIIVAKTI